MRVSAIPASSLTKHSKEHKEGQGTLGVDPKGGGFDNKEFITDFTSS